jgi:hypothetical protein
MDKHAHKRVRTTLNLASGVLPVLWMNSTPAQPASSRPLAPAQEQFVCQLSGSTDRSISIYRPYGSQRCRVDYTRDGKTRSLWSSGHEYQFCVRKALEIVKLLESVNYNCTPHVADDEDPALPPDDERPK